MGSNIQQEPVTMRTMQDSIEDWSITNEPHTNIPRLDLGRTGSDVRHNPISGSHTWLDQYRQSFGSLTRQVSANVYCNRSHPRLFKASMLH